MRVEFEVFPGPGIADSRKDGEQEAGRPRMGTTDDMRARMPT